MRSLQRIAALGMIAALTVGLGISQGQSVLFDQLDPETYEGFPSWSPVGVASGACASADDFNVDPRLCKSAAVACGWIAWDVYTVKVRGHVSIPDFPPPSGFDVVFYDFGMTPVASRLDAGFYMEGDVWVIDMVVPVLLEPATGIHYWISVVPIMPHVDSPGFQPEWMWAMTDNRVDGLLGPGFETEQFVFRDETGNYDTSCNPWRPANECNAPEPARANVQFQLLGNELAVEISSFTATVDGDDVVLEWLTSAEINNSGFEVQRRGRSSEDWSAVDFVEGHGTTTSPHAYRYRARDLEPGIHTFRLKQIDLDGSFAFSPIVEAALSVPGSLCIEGAYPNPFNPETTIRIGAPDDQHLIADLYDATGRFVRRVFDRHVSANAVESIRINGDGLASGLYTVLVRGESRTETMTIVLTR